MLALVVSGDCMFGWFKKKAKKPSQTSHLKFRINKSGRIHLDAKYIEGNEENYALLVYLVSTGKLVKSILETLKNNAATNGKEKSFDTLLEYLTDLENQEEEMHNWADDDEPVIKPSDVGPSRNQEERF